MHLAKRAKMRRDIVPISVGAAATGLIFREHTLRSQAERLSAATMETLLNAIDANDADTGSHVRRVASYALILGQAAGLDDRTMHSVERVALFHDIGKLHGALTDIFHESTKLTPEERRAVMTHPIRGAEGWQRVSSRSKREEDSSHRACSRYCRQLRRHHSCPALQSRAQLQGRGGSDRSRQGHAIRPRPRGPFSESVGAAEDRKRDARGALTSEKEREPPPRREEGRSGHHFPMAAAISRVAVSGSSALKMALITATPIAPCTVI